MIYITYSVQFTDFLPDLRGEVLVLFDKTSLLMMRLIAAICVALVSSQQHADPYASIRDAFGKMDPIPEGYVHHIDEELRRQLPGELPEISFTPNEDPFKVTILNEEDFKAKRANASRMIDGEDIFHSQVFGGTTEGHQRAWYERMLRKGLEAELRRRKKAGEPEFDIDEAIELNREEERQRLQKNEETQLEQEEEEASLLEVQESRRRTHSLRKSSHRAHRLRKSSRQKHASYFGSYRCERFKSCTACMEASDLECTDKAWKGDFKSDNKLDNKQKMPCMYKSMMSTYFVKGTSTCVRTNFVTLKHAQSPLAVQDVNGTARIINAKILNAAASQKIS